MNYRNFNLLLVVQCLLEYLVHAICALLNKSLLSVWTNCLKSGREIKKNLGAVGYFWCKGVS